MSHTIIYAKNFLRTSRGIIPMVLIGNSNCTEFHNGREVQARSWCPLEDQMIEMTEAELIPLVYTEYTSSQIFVFHGKWIGADEYPQWMLNGIKAAGTLEQYQLTNDHLSISCAVTIWEQNSFRRECIASCHTTHEIEEWLDLARDFVSHLGSDEHADIEMDFGLRSELHPAAIADCPVIMKRRNGYISGYKPGKEISCTTDIGEAIVFDNIADARNKLGYPWSDLHFVKIDGKTRKPPEKIYGIYIENGPYGESWVQKKNEADSIFPIPQKLFNFVFQQNAPPINTFSKN